MRQTKIVATLGPASESPEIIEEMITAGVNIFRFNASHGTHEEHYRRLLTVRQVAADVGRNIACLLDLQGPKIRLGKFENKSETLHAGDEFTISVEERWRIASVPPRISQPVNDVGPGSGFFERRLRRTQGNRCRGSQCPLPGDEGAWSVTTRA